MVGFGKELADLQGPERREVAVEDRCAADDDRLPGLLELDPAADFYPGIDGEVQVEQDHVERTTAGKPLHALAAVGGLGDLESLSPEELGDQFSQDRFVLDEQEPALPFRAHGRLP